MQEVDGIEAPKVINFWKGGNLSPQKKSKGTPSETIATKTNPDILSSDVALQSSGTLTPVRTVQRIAAVEKTALISSNRTTLHEIKKKLRGSTRLAELKTSLNKLNGGLDRREQMEKKRMESAEKHEASAEMPKALKPFKTIELEILR